MSPRYVLQEAPRFPLVGVISEGTLRAEDLLSTFADLLADLMRWGIRSGSIDAAAAARITCAIADAQEIEAEISADPLSDEPEERLHGSLQEISDLIDEHIPSGYRFGTFEGDGACFGIWADPSDEDLILEDASDEIAQEIAAACERDSFWPNVWLADDHGGLMLMRLVREEH